MAHKIKVSLYIVTVFMLLFPLLLLLESL